MRGWLTLGQRLHAPWVWNLIFALPFLAMFVATRFEYSLHGDEITFYPITLQFGAHVLPPVYLLRSYEQLQTPLMFWTFGLLGRVVGFDLWKLRTGVAILSYVTLLLFFRLCRTHCQGAKPWLPIYTTIALALSPYYLGASFYFYTDIPSLFALMVALTFYLSNQPVAGAVAAGIAMLIRQFSLFLPVAYALSVITKVQCARMDLRQGVALLLPFGILLPLIVLWEGLSPHNRLREMVHQVGSFHPEFVNYLVLATGAYALPLAVFRTREIFRRQRLVIIAVLAPLFWLAIPRPNAQILNLPVQTLGYLDIALTNTFGNHKTIPYFLLWLLGGLILCEVFSIEWCESSKLFLFAIGAFFVMNLFAHMVWDKYLLLVLPLLFLSLARGHARFTASAIARHGS